MGIGNTDIFGLAAVDAAPQRPSAVLIGTVIDEASLTEKTFSAEGFHIDGDPVAHRKSPDLTAKSRDFSNHFMAYDDSWFRLGDTAVFDVDIAGTDGCQGYFDDGIGGVFYLREGTFFQGECPRFLINDGIHLCLCGIIHNDYLLETLVLFDSNPTAKYGKNQGNQQVQKGGVKYGTIRYHGIGGDYYEIRILWDL